MICPSISSRVTMAPLGGTDSVQAIAAGPALTVVSGSVRPGTGRQVLSGVLFQVAEFTDVMLGMPAGPAGPWTPCGPAGARGAPPPPPAPRPPGAPRAPPPPGRPRARGAHGAWVTCSACGSSRPLWSRGTHLVPIQGRLTRAAWFAGGDHARVALLVDAGVNDAVGAAGRRRPQAGSKRRRRRKKRQTD